MNSLEVVELEELNDIGQIIDFNKKYCCCVNCCKSCCINFNKFCEYFFCIKNCNGNEIIIPIKNFFVKIFDKIVNLFKTKNNPVIEPPKQNSKDEKNCCDKVCFLIVQMILNVKLINVNVILEKNLVQFFGKQLKKLLLL